MIFLYLCVLEIGASSLELTRVEPDTCIFILGFGKPGNIKTYSNLFSAVHMLLFNHDIFQYITNTEVQFST